MFVLLCVIIAVTVLPQAAPPRFRLTLWIALALSAGVLIAARIAFFDSWLPQPALAKAGRPLVETTQHGLIYLTKNPVTSLIVAITACVGLFKALHARSKQCLAFTLASLFVGAQLSFVVFSGGDWMEGARFLAPVLPLSLVLLLDLFPMRALTWSLAFVLVATSTRFALTESRSLFAWQHPEIEYTAEEPVLPWCVERNLVHLRDRPTLTALKQILAALPPDEERVILTGQGGLLLFELLRQKPGSFRVVDRYGLVDRALTSLPVALQPGRHALGLEVRYASLAQNWEEIWTETGLPEPSLVFDLSIEKADARGLRDRGYVGVYRQTGDLIAGSKRQQGKQAIFLKRELVDTLPTRRFRGFKFSPLDENK